MKLLAATMLIAVAAWMPTGPVSAGEEATDSELQRQIARCWTVPKPASSNTIQTCHEYRLPDKELRPLDGHEDPLPPAGTK